MVAKPSATDRIEWALGFVSAAVVLTMIGYLAWEGMVGGQSLPHIEVEMVPPDEAGADADQVRFRVRNQGGRAASAVSLSLTLRDGGEIVSERRLVLDYLPGHSETTGGFVLPAGARGFAADLSIEGYLDP